MKKTYFVSFNIIDQGGAGIVGSGNTFVTLNIPMGAKAITFIQEELLRPNLPFGLSACVMNFFPVEGNGS